MLILRHGTFLYLIWLKVMPQNVKHLMKVHFVLSKLLSTLDFKVSEFVNKTPARHISVTRDCFWQEINSHFVILAFFIKNCPWHVLNSPTPHSRNEHKPCTSDFDGLYFCNQWEFRDVLYLILKVYSRSLKWDTVHFCTPPGSAFHTHLQLYLGEKKFAWRKPY